MERLTHLILAAILASGLAGAAVGQTPSSARRAADGKQVDTPNPDERIRTSDQLKSGSVQGAATAPLRDLNMIKTDIPEVLIDALKDPYVRPPRNWTCPALIAMVRPLDAALGPDLDQLPTGDENLMDRGKQTVFSVAGDLASGAIPFRGVVRRISGASSHDKLVQSAIVAGNIRRGYLKGLGEARGCPSPAKPARQSVVKTTLSVADKGGPTPKYPARTAVPQSRAGSSPSAPPKSRP